MNTLEAPPRPQAHHRACCDDAMRWREPDWRTAHKCRDAGTFTGADVAPVVDLAASGAALVAQDLPEDVDIRDARRIIAGVGSRVWQSGKGLDLGQVKVVLPSRSPFPGGHVEPVAGGLQLTAGDGWVTRDQDIRRAWAGVRLAHCGYVPQALLHSAVDTYRQIVDGAGAPNWRHLRDLRADGSWCEVSALICSAPSWRLYSQGWQLVADHVRNAWPAWRTLLHGAPSEAEMAHLWAQSWWLFDDQRMYEQWRVGDREWLLRWTRLRDLHRQRSHRMPAGVHDLPDGVWSRLNQHLEQAAVSPSGCVVCAGTTRAGGPLFDVVGSQSDL